MEALFAKVLDAAVSNGLSLGILIYLYMQNRKDLERKEARIELLQDHSMERAVAAAQVISANTQSSLDEARALQALDKRLERIEGLLAKGS